MSIQSFLQHNRRPHAFGSNLGSLLTPAASSCLRLWVIPPAFSALPPPSLMRCSCIARPAFQQPVLSPQKFPSPLSCYTATQISLFNGLSPNTQKGPFQSHLCFPNRHCTTAQMTWQYNSSERQCLVLAKGEKLEDRI